MNQVIVPIMVPREPEKCPKCHKPEDIKQTCRNCGYEYPEETAAWYETVLIIILILIGFVVFIVIFFIFMDWIMGEQGLVDIIRDKLTWWHNKRIL